MRVLPTVLTGTGKVALDVARIARGFVEGRRKEQDQRSWGRAWANVSEKHATAER